MFVTRRSFCAGLGATGLGCLSKVQRVAAQSAHPANELRVISYNILACTGWPADRLLARRAVEHGQIARRIALQLALYDPQVVTFSESPSEKLTRQIAELLEMHHVRFPSGESWPGTLLSKFEVIDSRNVPLAEGTPREADLFTRHWGRATLKLPSGEPLIVHSAHLFPVPDPTVRLREIDAMVAAMRGDLNSGKPLLLMGDLNHRPQPPEYPKWQAAGLVDTFAAVGQGDGNTFPASKPLGRIDYVWAAGPLAKQIKTSRPLFEGAFRTNPDDQQSFALSDHLPQYAAFDLP